MRNTILLKRERINKILSTVYDYPLTILAAPMGYGKTTAVKKFIEAEQLRPFWFTFPDLSNRIGFLEHFSDAIAGSINRRACLRSLGLRRTRRRTRGVQNTVRIFGEKNPLWCWRLPSCPGRAAEKLFMRLAMESLRAAHLLINGKPDIDFVEFSKRASAFSIKSI
jgi:hypothetical protein